MSRSESVQGGRRGNRNSKKSDKKTAEWRDRLVHRAMENANKGTTLLTMRPNPLKPGAGKQTEWVIVGEEEVEGGTLLTKGSKMKAPVFGTRDGHLADPEQQTRLRQIHRLTSNPAYARMGKHFPESRDRETAEKRWNPEGLDRLLEKTGRGKRAKDILNRDNTKIKPTDANHASVFTPKDGYTKPYVRLPKHYSNLSASLSAVHEAEHVDNPDISDELLENVLEEYRAARKQVEAYKDLRRQGYRLNDPLEREYYEHLEELYDQDDVNDAMAKHFFEIGVPHYRQKLWDYYEYEGRKRSGRDEKQDRDEREAAKRREEREKKPFNHIDSWAYSNGLLYEKFKERAKRFR